MAGQREFQMVPEATLGPQGESPHRCLGICTFSHSLEHDGIGEPLEDGGQLASETRNDHSVTAGFWDGESFQQRLDDLLKVARYSHVCTGD